MKKIFCIFLCFQISCMIIFCGCTQNYPIEKKFDGYTFEIDENQNATLTKTDMNSEIVSIPSKISSYDVKKLGGDRVIGGILFSMTYDGLFEGNSTVKEIIIPEGVEIIDDHAIYCCENLERIILPNTLTDIVIDGCDRLEKIDIPSSVINCSVLRCENIKEVNIADGSAMIERICFQDCVALKSIVLPNRIEQLPDLALSGCFSLETINIPQGVKSIGCWAFEWCGSLEKIILPENLVSVGAYAFRYCDSLERINIYDKCTSIADNAFEGCDNLTIYGIKGTYAERYADEHNIPFEDLHTKVGFQN